MWLSRRSTRETVDCETPAARATSWLVTAPARRPLRRPGASALISAWRARSSVRRERTGCAARRWDERAASRACRIPSDPQIAGPRVPLEVLDPTLSRAHLADPAARLRRAALVGEGLQELARPPPAGVAGRAGGRQDVVGADRLVAVGDGRLRAEKQRAVIAQALEVGVGI